MEYQELFDAITDSAVLLDKAGRIINWNVAATTFFGYTKREVLGRSVNFLYDRNYPFPKIIQEITSNSKKWHEETPYIRKNGLRGFCKSALCIMPANEQHKLTGLLIHQNITAQKQLEAELREEITRLELQVRQALTTTVGSGSLLIDAMHLLELTERRLRESEIRFHLLAENATDIISTHAADGTYAYVSPSCKMALGLSPDELVGKNIFKLVHHEDLTKLKKAFSKRREQHQPPITYRVKRKEGEFRWFESNIRVVMDVTGKSIHEIQLASRDVSDRIFDKKARLRGQQLAHVFRLSTMEEMASGMAHEISQPLAAIVNYTRGCVRHLENPESDREQLQQVMQKAVAQAERAGEIIQRLKNFFCKGQLIKSPCKVNNLIRETVSLIKNELTTSKTKIDFNFDKNVPQIVIDRIQIQQVILNLMQNAIEAMQETPSRERRIHIHTQASHRDIIEITLSDTGPGFTKEVASKVFMPFFTTKAHGRGMGLAICRSIIEAHGGQFTINPNHANQSWIRFSLPTTI